jgi:two-component system sensor histidine kinase CpxA
MASQLEAYVNGQKHFLRDAAHELRSPLSRRQAALAILERKSGPETERLINDLREEIELMSSLTGELLTFAREESRQRKLQLEPLALSSAAARAVAAENPDGKADCRVRVEEGLSVLAHPDSLFRGLSNVVRNAIRYAGDAGPITIAAEQRDGSAIVTVSDMGPGIPDESLELVFAPFYRLDTSRNRETGGHGLGMSIARSCIEACQGTIYCRNGSPGLQVVITLKSSAG